MKHRKIIIALVLAAVICVPSLTIWIYEYDISSHYGGVTRLMENQYFDGKQLPPPEVQTEFDPLTNKTVNITAYYVLDNFTYTIWSNSSAGSIELGVLLQPGPTVYAPGAPANTVLTPRPIISLLSYRLNGPGYIGFKVNGLVAYNFVPGNDQINYTNRFDPFPVSFWNVYSIVNFTTKKEVSGTLGLVYNINPVISNIRDFPISNYSQGLYFLNMKLDLFRVLPWGVSLISNLNISKPWIEVEY